MGKTNFLDGHARHTLVNDTGSVSQGGSVDFGVFQVNQYSRFTGLLSFTGGGATGIGFQWSMGVNSGTYEVSSTQTIVSAGALALDEINHGREARFAITSVDSDTGYTVLVLGEPLR